MLVWEKWLIVFMFVEGVVYPVYVDVVLYYA